MTEILGLYPDFFDFPGFARLGLRLALNLAFTAMIVLGVYVRRYGKNEYIFTYFMFNAITFALCFLLRKVPIELGFRTGTIRRLWHPALPDRSYSDTGPDLYVCGDWPGDSQCRGQ